MSPPLALCALVLDMAFDGLLITEIFYSLQGETSLIGVPFVFIRLTGCNLRCTYCDSVYSYKGGHRLSLAEVLAEVKKYRVKHVLLTGGEPLLQRNTLKMAELLQSEGYAVSIETHGEAPIEAASRLGARIIMDIKTPGSGENRGGYLKNLSSLKTGDEIKFVITSESDYEWARKLVQGGNLPEGIEILFSPAMKAENAPGIYEGIEPRALADRIVQDQLPVRFQWQLHKLLWGADTKGV
jgi:7-carboxy-7-deazaguanine synthase